MRRWWWWRLQIWLADWFGLDRGLRRIPGEMGAAARASLAEARFEAAAGWGGGEMEPASARERVMGRWWWRLRRWWRLARLARKERRELAALGVAPLGYQWVRQYWDEARPAPISEGACAPAQGLSGRWVLSPIIAPERMKAFLKAEEPGLVANRFAGLADKRVASSVGWRRYDPGDGGE